MQKPNTKTTNQNSKTEFQNRVYLYTLQSLKFIGNVNLGSDATLRIIINQLIRSLTSIGANIIEAQAGSSKKDFTNFFSYALKSANESKF